MTFVTNLDQTLSLITCVNGHPLTYCFQEGVPRNTKFKFSKTKHGKQGYKRTLENLTCIHKHLFQWKGTQTLMIYPESRLHSLSRIMGDNKVEITAEQVGPELQLDLDKWEQLQAVQEMFSSPEDVTKNPHVVYELFQDFKMLADTFYEFLTRAHSDVYTSDGDIFSLVDDMDLDLPPPEGGLNMGDLKIVHEILASGDPSDFDPILSCNNEDSEQEGSIISLDSYHSLVEDLPPVMISPELTPLLPVQLPILDLPLVYTDGSSSAGSASSPSAKHCCLRCKREDPADGRPPAWHPLAFRHVPDDCLPGFLSCYPVPDMGWVYTFYQGLSSLPHLPYAEMLGPCTHCHRSGLVCSTSHFVRAFQVPYWWRVHSTHGFSAQDAPRLPLMKTTNPEFWHIRWAYQLWIA